MRKNQQKYCLFKNYRIDPLTTEKRAILLRGEDPAKWGFDKPKFNRKANTQVSTEQKTHDEEYSTDKEDVLKPQG